MRQHWCAQYLRCTSQQAIGSNAYATASREASSRADAPEREALGCDLRDRLATRFVSTHF